MNLVKAEERARALMFRHGLVAPKWTFAWTRSKTQFGSCRWQWTTKNGKFHAYTKCEIRLSRFYTLQETEEHVEQTILHEIAHGLCGHTEHHGPKWKMMARKLGVKDPSRLTESSVDAKPVPKYVAVYDGKIVKSWLNTPSTKAVDKMESTTWVRGKMTESKGKIRVMPYSKFMRMFG